MNIIKKDNMSLMQREDGYINATAPCKQAGKQFNDYKRLSQTQEFISCLSAETGIPVSAQIQDSRALLEIKKGGKGEQGTYVHPQVAIHLAQWLSPEFAVFVSKVIFGYFSGHPLNIPKAIIVDPVGAALRIAELNEELLAITERAVAIQAETRQIAEVLCNELERTQQQKLK